MTADALTRDAILAIQDLDEITPVDVPEWHGQVCIRPMTAADRDAYELAMTHSTQNVRAQLAVRVACDPEGRLLFRPQDAAALGQKNGAALDRIFTAALHRGLLGADALEAARKNSATAQDSASASA